MRFIVLVLPPEGRDNHSRTDDGLPVKRFAAERPLNYSDRTYASVWSVHLSPNDLSTAGPGKQPLSAESWAAAALEAMALGGLDAVAVEPLARRLNVTKGSFYWHFPNREALIKAALELWEQRETVDVVEGLDREPDPYQRIVDLFKRANTSHKAGRLYLALAAASDDVRVNEVVQRVSARRLQYLEKCYRALGMSADEAPLWATFAYATFIGNQQVHRDTPHTFPSGPKFREYFKLMLRTLVPKGVSP